MLTLSPSTRISDEGFDRPAILRNMKFTPGNQHKCNFFNGARIQVFITLYQYTPSGWLSGERVGLMTWWLRVRSAVEATFLSGVFPPLTLAEACENRSRRHWKEKLCWYWCEKARKHISVTDRHHMTLAAKVHGVKGGYSDFSHLTEFKNIHVYMTEMPIYEKKKKDKSSTTKNYEI